MATDDLKEELFAIAKCTRHEDDALAFLENNYDALVRALEAAARIEALEAQLAGRDALIRDLAALPPGGEVWDRSKQLADFTLRARAIEAGATRND